MIIKPEDQLDIGSIRELVRNAFAEAPHSSGVEPAIVDKLREDGSLTLSLVAVDGMEIVGHVAVSPVVVAEATGTWFGLGPVSVHPSRQGQGIGAALIREALEQLRNSGSGGCVVLGEPAYYKRFGFEHDPRLNYRDTPPPYFQVLPFARQVAAGSVEYDPAFDTTG